MTHGQAARQQPAMHWSASWTSAAQQPAGSTPARGENWSAEGFADQSIRQVVCVSGGSMARIRLSNLNGTKPVRITAATIAESAAGAAARPGTMCSLPFRGRRPVTILAGRVTASHATRPVHLPRRRPDHRLPGHR